MTYSSVSRLLSFADLIDPNLTTKGFGSPSHLGSNSTLAIKPRSVRASALPLANSRRLYRSVNMEHPAAHGVGPSFERLHSFRAIINDHAALTGCGISMTDGGHRTPSISRPTSIAVFEEILRKVNAPGRVEVAQS